MSSGREYFTVDKVSGPIMTVTGVADVSYAELVEVRCPDGSTRKGLVQEVSGDTATIQIFEGTRGIATRNTSVRFLGDTINFRVTEDLLGRVLNGVGEPQDGSPMPYTGESRNVFGSSLNPASRDYPQDVIVTGVSAIDCMNTLVRGQKLPIFSCNGLPHKKLAAQIVRQAKILGKDERFAVIFAAIGLKHDDADFFRRDFEQSGAIENVTMFLNLATDPAEERILTPRFALTLAEYLAFDKDIHVLVVLTDMTNYCEALREIASAREEVPSRKGYPGYLYSDLASIYERCGRISGSSGSITQIPILTMPNDDITHPIPDLTGYITEGQIVLNRQLHQQGIYPPISVLPSLSRIMKDCIGEGMTREDHPDVSNQLYAIYSKVANVRSLASIVGEEELTDVDRKYLAFGDAFETTFLGQKTDDDRTIDETLDLAWSILSDLPKNVLHRLSSEQIEKHYNGS